MRPVAQPSHNSKPQQTFTLLQKNELGIQRCHSYPNANITTFIISYSRMLESKNHMALLDLFLRDCLQILVLTLYANLSELIWFSGDFRGYHKD